VKIKLDGYVLELCDKVKYLGIIIDSLLKLHDHIIYTANKIAKKVGYLARIGKYLTQWTKILIYETIIAPHYEYCSSIFLNANEKDIIRLQKLQNKAMRIILKCDWYTHSVDMLKKLNWLSISEKIRYKSLVFIHKTLSKEQDNVFKDLYKKNKEVHNINTRQSNKYHMQHQNNKSGQKSIFCNGLKIYNELHENIKQLNIKKFKEKLKSTIIDG
jgi:hypothetical protein